mmetsp:Transcript_9353/g.21320  ORF Transcript_9353/g.21320 Transcript_9353/m.21320 type:complete len:216 (-) Transcript_9353:996-1643(-)
MSELACVMHAGLPVAVLHRHDLPASDLQHHLQRIRMAMLASRMRTGGIPITPFPDDLLLPGLSGSEQECLEDLHLSALTGKVSTGLTHIVLPRHNLFPLERHQQVEDLHLSILACHVQSSSPGLDGLKDQANSQLYQRLRSAFVSHGDGKLQIVLILRKTSLHVMSSELKERQQVGLAHLDSLDYSWCIPSIDRIPPESKHSTRLDSRVLTVLVC